jgi:hypothetical protein
MSSATARVARPSDRRTGRARLRLFLTLAPLGVLFVALMLAVAPAWNPIWYQDDQLPTLFRTFHTDLAHHRGVWYPRLAPELGFGYGRLLHQFYPPLGVELASWLHTLGLGMVDAARATFSLCLISSALGMYAYGRSVLGGRWPGVLAGIGFLWAPYVLLDAHKGGVLGESIAMALMPWSLLAVDRLARGGGWRSFGAAAGSVALVVLGHNITALFFVGLASLYALLLASRAWISSPTPSPSPVRGREGMGSPLPRTGEGVRGWGPLLLLLKAAGAVGLGLALAAIYWLPALIELPYSRVSDQRTGDFTVTRYLVAPQDLLQPLVLFDYYVEAIPRYGLAAALLTIVSAGLVLIAGLRRPANMAALVQRFNGPDRLVVVAFALCFAGVLLLQLRGSAAVWDTVPLISFVQFPQRLFVFGSFAGAIVLGSAPWAIRALSGQHRLAIVCGIALGLLLGATSLPGIYWTWPVAGSHVIKEDDVGIGTVAERRLSERRAFDDYFPAWVEEDANQIIRPPSANRADAYRAASAGPAPRLELLERGYLHQTFRTEAEAPSTVILHQFYFPGWLADADGLPLNVEPVGPLGLVGVTVPSGQHLVRVSFGETPLRLTATGTSALALALLLAVFVRGFGYVRVACGVGLVLIIALGPRLLHDRLDPDRRPAVRPVQADVTQTARVVGLEIESDAVGRGAVVPVTLLWQAVDYTPRDLQTGIRLLPLDGDRAVTERWGRPNRERTPTGKWLVGEIVPDTLLLRIPNDAPPGRYRLLAGLRDPDANRGAPLGLAHVGELEIR